ncbi:hypothetical protein KSP39_PZI008362 [Platanthera zijinensis]|uniref:Carotenoid cleavage dioxygenase 7 n=1 Tax=Platanthera zijinensis TaxID=2320716 RepID=A0AAP0G8D2_9ASPA
MQTFHPHHVTFLQHPRLPINLFPRAAIPAVHSCRRRRLSSLSASTINHIDNLPAAAAAADFDDYQLLFSSQPAESVEPLQLLAVEGVLPADFPCGTYYLVGPDMISDSRGSTVNPLDGHGYLRSFHFGGSGKVMYMARYVETEAVREEREEATGKWRFRRAGIFSKLKAQRVTKDPSLLKNVANTTVLSWGGRLFCLWEGGHPYEIEPSTLATVGPADLIGAVVKIYTNNTCMLYIFLLSAGILGMPPMRTLSHYKIDAKRNMLLVLSCDVEDMFLPNSAFTFYEFDGNFNLKQKKRFLILDKLLIHDWAFTDTYYVLTGNRTKLNAPGILPFVSGLAPLMSTVSLNPSRPTTPIYLLPRLGDERNPARDWRIPVEAPSQFWTSHVGNAFEEKHGSGNTEIKIQASVCSYQWFSFKKLFGYDWESEKLDPSFMNVGKEELPHLVQISIMLNANGVCCWSSVVNSSSSWNEPTDFPIINPSNSGQRNKFLYASTTSGIRRLLPYFPFDSVIKLDCFDGVVKSWWSGSRRFVGEPMFVSKRTGDDDEDGYIIVVEVKQYAVFKKRCYLVVLDAKRVGHDDAVVAKMEVPEHLTFPFGFHGFWVDR